MEKVSRTYYAWVARDKRGVLKLFNGKPFKWKWFGEWGGDFLCCLNSEDFPDVTWENSPRKVKFKIELDNE